jgi:hypothetical protein
MLRIGPSHPILSPDARGGIARDEKDDDPQRGDHPVEDDDDAALAGTDRDQERDLRQAPEDDGQHACDDQAS